MFRLMIRGMLRLLLENVRWFSAVLYDVDAVALLSLAAASLQVSTLFCACIPAATVPSAVAYLVATVLLLVGTVLFRRWFVTRWCAAKRA
jgi:hypothetical protein